MAKPADRLEETHPTTLEDLIGCADYAGPSRSREEMEAAITQGAREPGGPEPDAPGDDPRQPKA